MKVEIDIQEKYEALIVCIKNNTLNDEVTSLMKKLESDTAKKIVGKRNDSIFLLDPSDIVFFYSEGNKLKADTMEKQYEVKEKLYVLEEMLQSFGFVRLSKYALANVNMIQCINVEFNGSLVVQFKNGKTEGISRRNITKVKKYLGI